MIFDYKFALRLKDAGFFAKQYPEYYRRIEEPYDLIPCPSLENLMDSCEPWFVSLTKDQKDWYAVGSKGTVSYKEKGSTREEAVANLWLKMNNK
jgi:hypothetical protein